MPFPGPETALPSTIDLAVTLSIIRRETRLYQPANRLQRLFNHLHEDSTTYRIQRGAVLHCHSAAILSSTMESGYHCAGCGEWNSTSVDESAGRRQSYVEDCQVCCKPNLLRIEYDNSSQEFFITAELE